jgi:Pentapeptide repeats (8 copies)
MANADLSGADLTNAELSGAFLSDANLRGARLVGTRLHGATVDEADFFEAIYETFDDPSLRSIAYAKNLEYATHRNNPEPLARLRSKFKEAGFREQERKVTFALKSRQTEFLWETCEQNKGNCFEYWVNRLLFDLPSQYGMNPGRVLLLILFIFVTCTLLYWFLIHTSKTSGLAILVPPLHDNQPLWLLANLPKKHEMIHDGSAEQRAFKVQPRDLSQYKKLNFVRHLVWRESSLIWVSFVFSLMSTFNIKFRDIDFGRWIKLLTVKEYNIRGVGWARTISGTQALLCVYLIALLLITYFGRPFE